jgi:hypothetical protein
MYLLLNKPDSALFWADKAINTPEYRLITERYGVNANKPGVPFMDMFYEGNENRDQGNTEALWVFQYAYDTEGGGGSRMNRLHITRWWNLIIGGVRPLTLTVERGGRGVSRQSLTKWAIESYEPQDDRGSHYAIRYYFILQDAIGNAPYGADKLPPGYEYGDTLWFNWDQDITNTNYYRLDWPYSRKVEGTHPTNPQEANTCKDIIYLRLAETYLLKAEAEYKLQMIGEAVETINVIRKRSNASEITYADIDIDFILDERSRELVLEEHRRWTLLRTGKWLERLQKYNKNGGQFTAERDTLYPIPQVVIDANLTKKMQQNPGYN